MAGVVTNKFRIHNAKQFFEAFSEAEPSIIYAFIGRTQPWPDDNSPPDPSDNIYDVEYDIWRNIISFKRVTAADVAFCTRRIDWESGTIYDEYSHSSSSLYSSDYYVVTDEFHVYKCLSNNRGAPSTTKPTGTLTTSFVTADGYKWKYMYTINPGAAVKFLTTRYIPVQTLTSDDGSTQWDVQLAAANGAVEVIDITETGANYTTSIGTLQSATVSTAVLDASASSLDGHYTKHGIYISSGTGAGQLRQIINYTGSTREATVNANWDVTPDSSSSYIVSPYLNFEGDGSGLHAYTMVANGEITDVRIIDHGQNYSWVDVVIEANGGMGANLIPMISPPGGHGFDAVTELSGRNVMINVRLQGTEGNTITTDNDFRVMGIIANPLYQDGSAANALNYSQMTVLTVESVSGAFLKDELIVGGTSNAQGYLIEITSDDDMRLTGVFGNFEVAETITGQTSETTATVTAVTLPSLKPYTGEIMYIENRSPIARSEVQIEDLKMIVRF